MTAYGSGFLPKGVSDHQLEEDNTVSPRATHTPSAKGQPYVATKSPPALNAAGCGFTQSQLEME